MPSSSPSRPTLRACIARRAIPFLLLAIGLLGCTPERQEPSPEPLAATDGSVTAGNANATSTTPKTPAVPDLADAVPGAILGHVSWSGGPAHEYVAQVMRIDGVGEHLTAITDTEGNYIIEDVPPGEYFMTLSDLYAFKTGWIRQRATSVTVGSGAVVTQDFMFDTGVSVRGTFTGMEIPANRVQVQLLRAGAPRLTGTEIGDQKHQIALAAHLEGTTYVRADGTFELLDIRPGTYEIRVRTYPESTVDRTLPWAPPEHVSEVVVAEEDVVLELVPD